MKDFELRDYFAGLAMQALVSLPQANTASDGKIAFSAYELADAMLVKQKNIKNTEDVWDIIVEMCVITEAVTPDKNDIRGTLNRLIDYHTMLAIDVVNDENLKKEQKT